MSLLESQVQKESRLVDILLLVQVGSQQQLDHIVLLHPRHVCLRVREEASLNFHPGHAI